MRVLDAIAVWLLWCVLTTGAAHAGKLDEAKRAEAMAHYDQGTKFYNLRDFARALEEFRAAYLLTGSPALLFNIGQCERQAKRLTDARESFRAFLRQAQPSRQQSEEVQRLITALDAQIKTDAETSAALAPTTPPQPPPPEPVAVAAPPPVAVVAPPPVEKRHGVSRSVIALSVVGGVLVVGLAVGLGVGLTRGPHDPHASEGIIHGN